MNNPDCDKNVCSQDSYGNVTANEQGGNDIRHEAKYREYTIDVNISVIAWKPDNTWLGKFPSIPAAKSAIDADIAQQN